MLRIATIVLFMLATVASAGARGGHYYGGGAVTAGTSKLIAGAHDETDCGAFVAGLYAL